MSHAVDVHRRHVPGIAWAIREIEDAENQHHRVIRRLGTDSGRRTIDAEFHSAGLPVRGVRVGVADVDLAPLRREILTRAGSRNR